MSVARKLGRFGQRALCGFNDNADAPGLFRMQT
jgi:hypothetical protein